MTNDEYARLLMHEKIEVGDVVSVEFLKSYLNEYDAEVLYVPVQSGDTWILRNGYGQVVYVQEFAKMTLKEKIT